MVAVVVHVDDLGEIPDEHADAQHHENPEEVVVKAQARERNAGKEVVRQVERVHRQRERFGFFFADYDE